MVIRSILLLLCVTAPMAPALSAPAQTLRCDDSLKKAFKPDALTTVIAVKSFRKGDPLILSGEPTARTPTAGNDLCLVKLNVGPGNPGPADAPSTSPGIGIEIWLPSPANWIGRVHAIGGNGWSGGNAGSPTRIANSMNSAGIAASEGAVTSTCDSGHSGTNPAYPDIATSNAAFALDPDGKLSKAQWRDHAIRSLHEQAVKTKALAQAYYGRAPTHAYFDGGSQGGRQGYKLAQDYPADYDGIAAIYPAINWTRWSMGDLYARLVYQRDLGGVALTEAQQDLVSNAAIQACDVVGGEHLGYIMDPAACRYDPTLDAKVLCTKDGGSNSSVDCVNKAQANAMNKIWYGITADGSVPAPAVDNGWDKAPEGVRCWFGPPRGASLYNAGMRRIFGGVSPPRHVADADNGAGGDMVAIALQDPTLAGPEFRNAAGNGRGSWLSLSYAQFAAAFDRAVALQPEFHHMDALNPDLSAFKARGGKLLSWHGQDDAVVHVQGTIQYYRSVVDRMGGLDQVQDFYKLYLVPGIGHSSNNGTANPEANPPTVGAMKFYDLMVDWVEKGVAPDRIEIESPPGTSRRISQPICPYPQRASYRAGDPRLASSYACAAPVARPQAPPPVAADPPGTVVLHAGNPSAPAEQWERLYGEYRKIRNVTTSTLTPFLPDPAKSTGAAVIVAPGGGFFELEIDHEGYMMARWLADHGIAAFVLKYRLQESPRDAKAFAAWQAERMKPLMAPPAGGNVLAARFSTPVEALEDGKAAICLVRARATEWHVDPARVGFAGFSAGAILTLSMAMIEDKALRPDFVAPIYGPMGALSVPAYAPPMFTAIALDDFLIPASNGQNLGLITSWRAAGRPVEAHLYDSGGHGFGMVGRKRALTLWIDEFHAWMSDRGLLK